MTATLSATTAASSADLAQQALLLRLLPPTKTAPSPRVVMNTCNKLFHQALSSEQWAAATNELRRAGLVENKTLKLTLTGRQQALSLLGIAELPSKTTWGSIQAKFLLPRSLGFVTISDQERKRLNTQDKLAALLLTRSLQLPMAAEASLKSALEALVCQKLGYPTLCSLEELKEVVLSQHLKSSERLTSKQLVKQVPRVLLGTKKDGLAALRDIALAGWADAIAPDRKAEPVPAGDLDLPGFAAAVQAAASACPTGWFGDNKVFISHVWRQLSQDARFASLGNEAFKQKLVKASLHGMLVLSRADLVQLMNPVDVDESATSFQNATFHFIRVDGKKS